MIAASPIVAAVDYSSLEHLARSVRTDGKWRESVFVMFTPYFDSSHTSGGKGVWVVSGWLSTVEKWERFTVDWKLVLAKFNVPYLHMKEFAHSTGAFADGWKGENNKRELFIRTLISVIKDHAIAGFSSMIENSVFEEVDKEYEVRENFGNEFALCGRTCAAKANLWLRDNGYDRPAEYVFEAGDERGRLTHLFESQGYPPPIFRPSHDRIANDGVLIRGLVPLQAADLMAYELRKAWDTLGDVDGNEIWKYRKSFLGIGMVAQRRGDCGNYTANDLRDTCKNASIPKRNAV